MHPLLDGLAIAISGLMVGNEFAVAAFIHPAISRLSPGPHLAAAKEIAAALGRAVPFWYGIGLLAFLLETWSYRSDRESFILLLVASLLWAATIVWTIVALVPRNNRIAAANLKQPYPTWQADRAAWDALHRVRVILLAAAFVLLLVAVLHHTAGLHP